MFQFCSDVYNKGWGNTTQQISASGITVGASASDYIKAFSKAKLGFSSGSLLSRSLVNSVLTQVGFSDGLGAFNDVDQLLARIDLQSTKADFATANLLKVNAGVNVKNIPFELNAKIPYLGIDIKLDGENLMNLAIKDIIVSPLNDRSGLSASVYIEGSLLTSDKIKTSISQIVEDMQVKSPTSSIRGLVSVSGAKFGYSAQDYIDSASLVVGELSIVHVAKPGAALFGSLVQSIQLNDVAVGIADDTTLSVNVDTSVKNPIPTFYAKIPYLYLEGYLDDDNLIRVETFDQGVIVDGGHVVLNATSIVSKNAPMIQKLGKVVGNAIFHRPQNVTEKLTVKALRFGASKESAFSLAETSIIGLDIAQIVASATTYIETPGQTLELTDIQVTTSPKGLVAKVTGSKLPQIIPFRSLPGAGAIAKVMWAPDGEHVDAYLIDAYFYDIRFIPNEPFSFTIELDIFPKEILKALPTCLFNLVTWKSYSQGILLGDATLTNGDPRSPSSTRFTSFDQVKLVPKDLYMYDPLLVKIKGTRFEKGNIMGDIDVYFSNPGPLHIDLGSLGVELTNNNGSLVGFNVSLNTLNNLEGGAAERGNTIPISFKITLNLFYIFKSFIDLLIHIKNFDFKWFSKEEWFTEILDGCIKIIFGFIPKFGEILGAVTKHIKFVK